MASTSGEPVAGVGAVDPVVQSAALVVPPRHPPVPVPVPVGVQGAEVVASGLGPLVVEVVPPVAGSIPPRSTRPTSDVKQFAVRVPRTGVVVPRGPHPRLRTRG